MLNEILKWLFFGIGLSLVPILVGGFGAPNFLSHIINSGELLLVAASLCGAATGELIASGHGDSTVGIVASGMSMIIVMASSLFYSRVKQMTRPAKAVAFKTLLICTLGLFGACVISSTVCVAL